MRLSTALRIITIIIVAKAVLIGVAYWRRAEILGRPLYFGADSWIGLVTIIATGLALAAGIYVAARHYRVKPKRCTPPPANRSSVPCRLMR
jgi:hypothetical protein